MTYNDLLTSFRNDPREVPTAPTTHSAPKWFYVYAHHDKLYVTSAKNHSNPCSICPARLLKSDEYEDMLEIYQQRKIGRPVSQEAAETSINASYWFGIFSHMTA